jgi:hypothetical protein
LKTTSETRIDCFRVVVASLLLAGFLMVGTPAQSQTVFLKEIASITTTKINDAGDLTTKQDSYFNDVTPYFSKAKECSGIRLLSNNKADYRIGFSVAHILQDYTLNYEVSERSGLVLGTKTVHSIPDMAKGACALIESRKHQHEPPERRHPAIPR